MTPNTVRDENREQRMIQRRKAEAQRHWERFETLQKSREAQKRISLELETRTTNKHSKEEEYMQPESYIKYHSTSESESELNWKVAWRCNCIGTLSNHIGTLSSH